MIRNRNQKINQIVSTITTRIAEINDRYRKGASLYFYNRIFELRRNCKGVQSFLSNDYNVEILYATLVAWDMNSRRAKMKYFDDFRENILSCMELIKSMDEYERNRNYDSEHLITTLRDVYKKLHIMRTTAKLVSNSKILHFLFPKLCTPMDRKNTLRFFYGNTGETENKFIEILHLTFEIMTSDGNLSSYIDNGWNKTIPKLIDNAIILLVGESVE